MMVNIYQQRIWISWLLTGLVIVLAGCHQTREDRLRTTNSSASTSIRFNGISYELLRHGKLYFIEGAGGVSHFEELKAAGGNSVRIWDDIDADRLLDEAHALGLTVMFGLWVEREMEGFNYNDQAAVERQYERVRKTVLRYRNHPALLLWCVGNEWSQEADNFKVFGEVNRLARLVHELDPDHPVSTAISPDSKRAIWLVSRQCPDVDILAVNSYGLTDRLDEFFRQGGWTKPYLISEYGAPAYWEVPSAPWGAPDEPDSKQKNASVRQFYQKHIAPRPAGCFGAYLFYWGNKQEETHTWFSVFDEQGHQMPLVGMMRQLWSGQDTAINQAPEIGQLLVDNKPGSHRSFGPDAILHRASIRATDPDRDSLTYHWELKMRAQPGSDYVGVPRPALTDLLQQTDRPDVLFRLPQPPGAYRLFVNVYDTHRHVATANFSFEVR